MTKRNMKIYTTTFVAVKILYVESAREFYVIEVKLAKIRLMFVFILLNKFNAVVNNF